MTLKEQFEQAIADSKSITAKPDNNTLLQLYSLYKQATQGDAGSDDSSNPFDFIAKAKHNAWAQLKGLDAEGAMKQYIDLIASLKG
jgi:diazepam-binding inhibitor (GABA receptor modulator, acyl-CoA-binding protein)